MYIYNGLECCGFVYSHMKRFKVVSYIFRIAVATIVVRVILGSWCWIQMDGMGFIRGTVLSYI